MHGIVFLFRRFCLFLRTSKSVREKVTLIFNLSILLLLFFCFIFCARHFMFISLFRWVASLSILSVFKCHSTMHFYRNNHRKFTMHSCWESEWERRKIQKQRMVLALLLSSSISCNNDNGKVWVVLLSLLLLLLLFARKIGKKGKKISRELYYLKQKKRNVYQIYIYKSVRWRHISMAHKRHDLWNMIVLL